MYYKLKNGILKEIMKKSFSKAGNIYKLESLLKISKSNLSAYHMEKMLIKDTNLSKITKFLGVKIRKSQIDSVFPDNWRQIKAGNKAVMSKKQKGTFNSQLKICQKGSSKYMKNLHEIMKKREPEKYYLSQYEKFKKIGEYKYITIKGEKVRNKLEKDTADNLTNLGMDYKYEPYVNIQNKAFFPDFLIENKFVIECTTWRGYDKAIKLKEKIKVLKKKYKVYVLIPKALNKYYKILNNHLIFEVSEMSR